VLAGDRALISLDNAIIVIDAVAAFKEIQDHVVEASAVLV
jgi:hypothetical protein